MLAFGCLLIPADVSTTDACTELRMGGNVRATVGALNVGALVASFDGERVGRNDGCLDGKREGIVVGGGDDGAMLGDTDGCSDTDGDCEGSNDTVGVLVGGWVGGSGVL